MRYVKPNSFYYRFAQLVAWPVAACIFKRKVLRNEIKDVDGPFLVIANHQAAYDFVNLIGICKRRMSFVISNSFYQSLPIRGILDKLAVIPKQQFQTTVSDMKKIRAVVEAGEPLVIYPAGLMCEDGLSTPIPTATYKLFKWLGVDVYMAKTCGTYFAMPKWASGFRPGKTTLDVYKLFDKEELKTLSPDAIRERAESALLFDAYREQEQLLVKYKNGANVHGLQNVLYACPHCGTEFSIVAQGDNTLRCDHCGYSAHADEYGFLHKDSAFGPELRYVSDWSRRIYTATKEKLTRGEDTVFCAKTAIHMVDPKKKKYQPVGEGTVTLAHDKFLVEGTIHGERVCLNIPSSGFPSLPFTPGKHIEIQDGQTIYRCVLEDGRLAMKFINMIKIVYESKAKNQPQEMAPVTV